MALVATAYAPPVGAAELAEYAGRLADVTHTVVALQDTSAGSADAVERRPPFDADRAPAVPGCVRGRVYWRRGGGPPPPCDSAQWVEAAPPDVAEGQRCAAAAPALRARGWEIARRLVQWRPDPAPAATTGTWAEPVAGARGALECVEDRLRHGAVAGALVAAEGQRQPWSEDARREIDWDEVGAPYALYSAEFVAWWHGSPRAAIASRATAADAALAALAEGLAADLALVRYDWRTDGAADAAAQGGMVVLAATPSLAAAPALPTLLAAQPRGGGAPLGEALAEAIAYLRGAPVHYGRDAHAAPDRPFASVAAARDPADPHRYLAPWRHACSRGALLAFAPASPSHDGEASARAALLPGFDGRDCGGPPRSPCLGALARWLGRSDLGPLPGVQRADLHWAVPAAVPDWLGGAAPAGTLLGGDADLLPLDLVHAAHARFAAPAELAPWSAEAHVRATLALGSRVLAFGFRVPVHGRWAGELHVAEAGDTPAGLGLVGGRPLPLAIAPPASRRLYVDLAGADLVDAANALHADNPRVDGARLGRDGLDAGARGTLLAWARGVDVDDEDRDGDRAEPRAVLGAVLNGTPVAVRHAGAGPRVYVGTTDGWLHALDVDGREHWAWLPARFLPRLPELREAAPGVAAHAGLDGGIRVLRVDRDGDGRIDPARGERALLYLGLRRGGRAWYALDVSRPDQPRVAWTLGAAELPGLGQTWAAPVPARLEVAGARQNAERHVVLLAGGFDPSLAAPPARPGRTGAQLYLVDALTGERLWHAGGVDEAAADQQWPELRYAIAATPRLLDLDGDGRLDRAYVADVAGRVLRIDFSDGAAAPALARVRVLAELGGPGAPGFYAEPDVALVLGGRDRPARLAVTLGAGFAPGPGDATTGSLYSLRDALPGGADEPREPLRDADLHDLADGTPVPSAARGWMLRLRPRERIVAAATTIEHRVYVPAWTPPVDAVAPDCSRRPGANRLYALDVRDGRPVGLRVRLPEEPDDAADAAAARARELPSGGALPGLVLLHRPPPSDCARDCRSTAAGLLGIERVDVHWPGTLVRVGWREREDR